jgi:hypothetical protein
MTQKGKDEGGGVAEAERWIRELSEGSKARAGGTECRNRGWMTERSGGSGTERDEMKNWH